MPLEGPVNPSRLPPIRDALAKVDEMTARIKAVRWVGGAGLLLIFLGQLKPLIQYLSWAFSPIFTFLGALLVILSIVYVFQLRLTMNKTVEKYLAFIFGVVFVGALIVLAISFPIPSPFQYTVFRIVLALAAAGVAAMIPGFLEVQVSKWIRGSGALGVFLVVYFFSPAALAV
jgi:hypothetical protein